MTLHSAWVLRCDYCSQLDVFNAQTMEPQDALTVAIDDGWTVYGDVTHCPECPPLCGRCGANLDNDLACPACAVVRGQS